MYYKRAKIKVIYRLGLVIGNVPFTSSGTENTKQELYPP